MAIVGRDAALFGREVDAFKGLSYSSTSQEARTHCVFEGVGHGSERGGGMEGGDELESRGTNWHLPEALTSNLRK